MAYGDEDHEQVRALRRFRNDVPASSPWGRRLIAVYYRGGPGIAAVVARHRWARDITRSMLDLVVGRIRTAQDM